MNDLFTPFQNPALGDEPIADTDTGKTDGQPFNEQLGSIRMTASQRREAIVHMRRGETIADLILGGAGLLRRAAASVAAAFSAIGIRNGGRPDARNLASHMGDQR